MVTPVLARFAVTGPRLYIYVDLFVNEDTGQVFVSPKAEAAPLWSTTRPGP